ncbi:MAG TPA: lysophospholipid acyltransferase family protein, partial [Candidatus Binataceae bacterium]|nr:lysophospholipid acyltransferase family protein [Candidatus Binataceae bacterium]
IAALRTMSRAGAFKFGERLGLMAMRIDRPNRAIALKNLEIAFPEKSREAHLEIIRGMYRNWGRMLGEWSHMGKLDRSNIEQYAVYEGKEHWDEAERISKGRGGLVLTAHFGNFELMILAHSIYGYRIAVVHRPLRNPLIDKAVREARIRSGNGVVTRKGAGMEMMRLLRQNWHVGVPLDLDVRKGVFVDFFGLPASTSDGVARLARATGAPVVPCFMVREGDTTHHKIQIQAPIEVVRTSDAEADSRENTQRFEKAIEKAIREHPDHWNWIHRRWKTRPKGEARFY